MTSMKASQLERPSVQRAEFRIVCVNCDALGIVFDCTEDAPAWTPIRCQHCGAARGTLGDLRELSVSPRQNLFDV
jgi:ribosomal protein S27E